LLGFEQSLFAKKGVLRCWNIDDRSWLSFDVRRFELDQRAIEVFVYKNSLVTFGNDKNKFCIAFLDLDHTSLRRIKSPEEKNIMSLFLKEEGSDVAFEIEGKTLPAHREILIKRSKYFEGLLKSGMTESRQNVIEIPDCEYTVFQEFVRFVYSDEVKLDIDIAQKLAIFAEMHLKDDLKDKCIEFLDENKDLQNVYTILDFAR